MVKSGSPRVAIGDVFGVRLDADRVGYGQVVGKYMDDGYFFALFERAYPRSSLPNLGEVTSDRIALLGLSLDGRIASGDWPVVGSAPVQSNPPLPAYREVVGTPDRVDIVDYSGERRRPATPIEAALLPNRKFVAPVRLERALRALHGLEPWLDVFDDLKPRDTTTARLFGDRN